MKRKRKGYLSLLEVMIALALTTVLLTALFNGFRSITEANAKAEIARDNIHRRCVCQLRLAQVFNALETSEKKSLFYTGSHPEGKESALFFTFNNGVDPEIDFCEEIEGALLCDRKNRLTLITLSKAGRERREVFFTAVEEFSFLFFDPYKLEWTKEWKEKNLPLWLKIVTKQSSFAFEIEGAIDKV